MTVTIRDCVIEPHGEYLEKSKIFRWERNFSLENNHNSFGIYGIENRKEG